MKYNLVSVIGITFFILTLNSAQAQFTNKEFGKGFNLMGKDSSFSLNAAFRFQTLFLNDWTVRNDDFSKVEDHESSFLIRRARLKFEGFAYSPKLEYKFELGLSQRDINNDNTTYLSNASQIIYDAVLNWNFYKGFSLKAGQTKLPGNRERVVSSGNLQFVDRSVLNAKINLDRDIGFQLIHESTLGEKFDLIAIAALSQGEGRNITAGNIGGYQYTFRLEALPFGQFASKGDYVGSDVSREAKPKLSIGFVYDHNDHAGRTNGNLGSFIEADDIYLKTLQTGFVDLMFKYKGFSLMGEYAIRGTSDKNPYVLDESGNKILDSNGKSQKYYTGSALNIQAGYLFKGNYEFALRYTKLVPHNLAVGNDEDQYFVGYSRYIKGHKLKVQMDLGYSAIEGRNDELIWRTQIDIHF